MMEYLGFSLLSSVFVIWMVIIIWRDSALMAILTFFIWPIAILPLIQNWGVKGRDIRLPFTLCVISVIWSVYNVTSDPDQVAAFDAFTAIEELRVSDPARAEALDQEVAEELIKAQMEGRDPDFENLPGMIALRQSHEKAQAAAAPPTIIEAPEADDSAQQAEEAARLAAEQAANLQRAALSLAPLTGTVALAPANASLVLPASYKFIPTEQTQALATAIKLPPMPGEIGWVVHSKVDLTQATAWFVRVGFDPGHLTLGNPSELAASVLAKNSTGQPSFSTGEMGPTWNAQRETATWGQRMLWGQHTVKLLAHGALVFSMHSPLSEPEELGIRATRLLASKVTVDKGFDLASYTPETHGAARGELATFIAGDRKL